MKKFWIIALMPLLALKCNFEDPTAPRTPTQLPPETQEGANTFGFLANGELWYNITTRGFGAPPGASGKFMVLYTNYSGPGDIWSCNMHGKTVSSELWYLAGFKLDTAKLGVIARFNSKDFEVLVGTSVNDAEYNAGFNSNYYRLDTLAPNYFEFTVLSKERKIAAGRFDLHFVNTFDSTKRLHLSQGRFDWKLI